MKKPTDAGSASPASLGFRMPAEWERHEATWIGWPHNSSDWPGKLTPIHWVYAEIVRKLAASEIVRVLVNSAAHEARARRYMARADADLSKIEFFRFKTNRGWTRDSGPMFITRKAPSETAVIKFQFNAWAKYNDWDKDQRIPQLAAHRLGCTLFEAKLGNRSIVLEGGSIDVNGRGTLITTEECLLDANVQVRNPGLTGRDLEQVFKEFLGAANVLWLGRGIAGDDTHGHVDDLCRFVGHQTVVLCTESNPHDENYRALEENRERLQGMRLEDGTRLEVVMLPMPAPLYFDGRRAPCSYATFHIANEFVLVPTFNDPNDRTAIGVLSELFTSRRVVGIHAVDLVWGLGTLHCLTQQQPAAV